MILQRMRAHVVTLILDFGKSLVRSHVGPCHIFSLKEIMSPTGGFLPYWKTGVTFNISTLSVALW